MASFFITATGTGVGKTLTTCSLAWQLRLEGKSVTALKPVISGYDPADAGNDAGLILQSCGLAPTPEMMETISPWRYRQPIAPSMAAAGEGNPVELGALVGFCREHAALESDIVLVEGVGGVMAPLNDQTTVLDWMAALNWPVLLVAGGYVGTISHTLTAVAALASRGLKPAAIILSESDERTVPLMLTAATLEKFLPDSVPLVKIPRVGQKIEPWKHTPPIGWLCGQ